MYVGVYVGRACVHDDIRGCRVWVCVVRGSVCMFMRVRRDVCVCACVCVDARVCMCAISLHSFKNQESGNWKNSVFFFLVYRRYESSYQTFAKEHIH